MTKFLSLRPQPKTLTQVGVRITVLGKDYFVQSAPSNKVIKFLTQAEYKKQMAGMANTFLVQEDLRQMDGTFITIYYIKNRN